MAFFASKPLQQKLPYSIPLCKCPSLLSSFKFQTPSSFLTSPLSKHPLRLSFLVGRGHANSHYEIKVSITDQQLSKSSTNHGYDRRAVSHSRDKNRRAEQKSVEKGEGSEMGENVRKSARRDRFSGERVGSMERSRMDSDLSSMSPEDENLVRKLTETIGNLTVKKAEKKPKKGVYKKLGVEKMDKGSEQSKSESPEVMLRVGLDMCSKKGDVMGALELYDSAQREGIKIGQYHYNVLLYLCSSAAIGVVQPAKSGSGNRTLNTLESSGDISAVNSEVLGEVGEIHVVYFNDTVSNNLTSNSELLVKSNNHPVHTGRSNLDLNRFVTNVGKDNSSSILNGKEKFAQASNGVAVPNCREIDVIINSGSGDYVFKSTNDGNKLANYQIQVNEDLKKYALRRGYEIYEKMRLEKIPMNEASLTSVARMALAMGNGDMAFDTVKQMKALGINPRLRSYGPALSAFCTSGNIEKAFSVEQHMQENGVHPEEPELEMLLRVSIEAGRSDKVYYLLHKLRTGVRRVSPSTADLIEKWFKNKIASQVGKRKWDQSFIREAIENGGGGWHGQGWLGKGKWTVSCTSVGDDGLCKCCGEKLATIDLDPKETEKFAESVASIAVQREKNSSFQKFQKWLDYYGPFEAVIDGANIGLYTQRKFKPSKVNAVVNGIRQLLPSKTWPHCVA
ncbi:Ribonuclease P [Bertholletia excelsa]